MSDAVKFDVLVASLVGALAVIVLSFASVPPEAEGAGVVASAYCAEGVAWPPVTARAVYVEDLSTHTVLYEKNAEAQLPLASLTKLMTVFQALDALVPNDSIEIPTGSLEPEGDSGLYVREVWNIQDLVDFTLMTSSNDGAHALALAAVEKRSGTSYGEFIFQMNERAKNLNMSQTFFVNDTGLDAASTTAGAMGSARDMGKLLAEIRRVRPDAFAGSVTLEQTFNSGGRFTHTAKNTSTIGSIVPGASLSKTGFTDLAGGNLAVIFEPLPGHPTSAVVLGSTREGRDIDMQLLSEVIKLDLKRRLVCEGNI